MNSFIRSILFLLFLFYSFYPAQSVPSFDITKYEPENGLNSVAISAILQDQRDYMWYATWDGLIRFDGYEFKTFKAYPGDGNDLSGNRFDRFVEDENGNIWGHMDHEIVMFDVRNEKFLNITKVNGLHSEFRLRPPFKKTNNGCNWSFYENGDACRIETAKPIEECTHYFGHNDPMNCYGRIFNIFLDSENREWLLCENGIGIYEQDLLTTYGTPSAIIENNKRIYVGFRNGKLYYYNTGLNNFELLFMLENPGEIYGITALSDEELIICAEKGAFIYNTRFKKTELINMKQIGLSSMAILSAFVDSKGEVWLEPSAMGIINFNPQTRSLKTFCEYRKREPENLGYKFFNIQEDQNGLVWFGLKDRSLWVYNRESGKMTSVFELLSPYHRTGISPVIRGTCFDRQGNLWVNTSEKDLFKLSYYKKDFDFEIISGVVEVRSFLLDSQHNVWIAAKDGNIRIYDSENNFRGYLSVDGKLTLDKNRLTVRAYSLMEDSQQNVWIGTKYNGLYYLEKKGIGFEYEVTSYKSNENDLNSLQGEDIYAIFQDSDENVWVGAYDGGLNRVKKGNYGELLFLNQRNRGISIDLKEIPRIRCINECNGFLLVGTRKGLLIRDMQSDSTTFFNRNPYDENSLSGNEVMCIRPKGKDEVYVSISGGGLDILKIERKYGKPNLNFTSFSQKNGLPTGQLFGNIEDKYGNLWVVSETALSRFSPRDNSIETFTRNYFKNKIGFSEALPIMNNQGELLFGCDNGYLRFESERLFKSDYVPRIRFSNFISFDNGLTRNIDFIDKLLLTKNERNFAFSFAALDFKGNSEIRYAYRLKGLDQDWLYLNKGNSAIYTNVPAGNYLFEVRSTNNDGKWVENTRSLPIVIEPRFHETIWSHILYGFLIFAIILIITRVWVVIYKLRHKSAMSEEIAQLKIRFFTDISHELRTPLTLISSPLDEVIKKEDLTEYGQRNLRVVKRNADRLLLLIDQILDFRKIQNNKIRLNVEDLDIVGLLYGLMEHFTVVAEEKNIAFGLKSEKAHIRLWCDQDKMEKIVINLLSNAFKYTPAGKSIVIEIKETELYVILKIRDQGAGMSNKQISKVFDYFESFKKTNYPVPSSGIGMSVVKNLVDAHHGEISVESKEGIGSCFTLRFQKGNYHFRNENSVDIVCEESHVQFVKDRENRGDEANRVRQTILVVEDNDELREFIADTLSDIYDVFVAKNGCEALSKIELRQPNLIVSDIMMPEVDGLTMVKRLKIKSETSHIPIILLSARSSIEDRIEGLKCGVDDYITKPFSAMYLQTRISGILERYKRMQENIRAQLEANIESSEVHFEFLSKDFDMMSSVQECDRQFITMLMSKLEERMADCNLSIDDLANDLCMSRSVFYRKLKGLTGLPPVDFIRNLRIKKAAALLRTQNYSVSQIAYMTGFSNPKYFARCFKKEFGVIPSEYE